MYHPLSLFIGLRYTRAKRRNHFISFISAISMIGIALGVIVLITVLSVMNGFHKEVRERILGMASHAEIRALGGELEDWQTALTKAQRHPEVVGAAPFVEAQAMLSHVSNVSGALVRGIDPQLESAVVDVEQHMVKGKLSDLTPGAYHIILGKELADVLGVRVGDKVTLLVPQTIVTPMGSMPRMKRFTVSGIFEVGMGEYDRGVAMVHMADAAKLLRMGDGVSGVRLKLKDLFKARQVSHELARDFDGLFRVLNWTDYHKNFFSALDTEKRMMAVLLFFIIVIAAFNIVATLVMAVVDKQSDIAILKTFGASPAQIRNIFMIQGAVIGVVGTVIGTVLGIALSLTLEDIVAALEQLFGVEFIDPSVYYIAKLPSQLLWSDVALVTAGSFLLTLLMTLYPARQAFKVQPAEALRYE